MLNQTGCLFYITSLIYFEPQIHGFFQFETMSAVTSQPLPFDRLEREKHIQAIFRAFKNRCGPSCQCHLPSPGLPSLHQTPPPDWEYEAQSSVPPLGTRNGSRVEKRWPAAGSHFMSTLQAVDKIEITARPEVQGGSNIYRFIGWNGKVCHCRSTMCSPEDLQHRHWRKEPTVICGCRRYSATFLTNIKLSLCSSALDLFFLNLSSSESSCVCLQCCGPARACSLQGFDCRGRQVFYFERPPRVDACCLGCCLMEMGVYTPQKQLIGTVRQRLDCLFLFLFSVIGSSPKTLYKCVLQSVWGLNGTAWHSCTSGFDRETWLECAFFNKC